MKRILLVFFCVLSFACSYAQGDGVKMIEKQGNVPVKKSFTGQEKKSVSKLLIRKQWNSVDLDAEDVKFISRLPALEDLTVDEEDFLRWEFAMPRLKRLCIPYDGSTGLQWIFEGTCFHAPDESVGERVFRDVFQSQYPNLEEFVLKCDLEIPLSLSDSLYVDYHCGNGFYPILLLGKNEVVFKRIGSFSNVPKEKQLYTYYWPSERNMLPCFDKSILKETRLVVPSTVQLMEKNLLKENKNLQEVIFEEGEAPIIVEEGNFTDCKNLKKVVCRRPISMTARTYTGAFTRCDIDEMFFEKDCYIDGRQDYINAGTIVFGGRANLTRAINQAKKIVFKKEAKLKYAIESVQEVVFEDEATLGDDAISGCGQATFHKLPKANNYAVITDVLIVPKGQKADFPIFGNSAKVYEMGDTQKKHWNISVEKPGTFMSVLPPQDLPFVDSLTITGYLYDTDLKILQDCINLRYLDIRQTIVTPSPESIKEDEAEQALWGVMGNLMGTVADAKYKDGDMSTMDYLYAKGFAELLKPANDVKNANKDSYIPAELFRNHKKLETVLLPYRCESIRHEAFAHCPNLKRVQLPLYLEKIGDACFSHCEKLAEIEFPASLKSLGWYTRANLSCAFGHTAIDKIDVSQCSFANGEWRLDLGSCKLKEVRLPANCKTVEMLNVKNDCHIYFPSSVENLDHVNLENATLHFKGSKAPAAPSFNSYTNIKNCTFYIPKGSTTSYYSIYGGMNSYVEE